MDQDGRDSRSQFQECPNWRPGMPGEFCSLVILSCDWELSVRIGLKLTGTWKPHSRDKQTDKLISFPYYTSLPP